MPTNQGATVPITAKILFPMPLDGCYDYLVPVAVAQTIQVGDVVSAPFQSRVSIGVVWHLTAEVDLTSRKYRLKELLTIHSGYHIPVLSRSFIEWVADYTFHPRGLILKMLFNVPQLFEASPVKIGYVLTLTAINKEIPIPLQSTELSYPRTITEIMRITACSRHRVQQWIKQGWLLAVDLNDMSLPVPDPNYKQGQFSAEQNQAICQISHYLNDKKFSVTVLDGVTGSGKTAVYFESIAHVLKHDQQILVMLPEIALSPQTIQRFKTRFGVEPAVWHSHLSLSLRKKTWQGINTGAIKVVIGARSALFLPFKNLGLIIVDEEHEQSYKQEEGIIYNARDMAVARAKLGNIAIILVSATPSLETVYNWQQGRYHHVELPHRYNQAQLPTVKLIDCSLKEHTDANLRWISKPLAAAIQQNLFDQRQTLLFLNRRGYAPLTLCTACGNRLNCQHCSTSLVEHRFYAELRCHQCGYAMSKPKACPTCHDADHLISYGPGVERLHEEVQQAWPQARTLVMASDIVQNAKHLTELITKIHERDVDIVIGTQMMAKGHHFEHLTLVGVIDADVGLNGGDLRACEKTYQLLHQVSGRAGRAEYAGEVLVQTYFPDHPVMTALVHQDRQQFIQQEMAMRAQNDMPPFTRLTALILSSAHHDELEKAIRKFASQAPLAKDFYIMGPIPAPLNMIRGRHRWRLLLRSPKSRSPQPYLRQWLKHSPLPSSIRLQVDIDPYTFL